MKLFITTLSLFFSSICIAQNDKTIAKPCEYKYPTSITQVADVKPSDTYFTALQNLLERFGVITIYNNDSKFYPNEIFTNAKWVVILNSCIGRMNEIIESLFDEDYDANYKKRGKEQKDSMALIKAEIIFKMRFVETYDHKYETIKQVKDVKESDCFYNDAYGLLEVWRIDFTNQDGLMHPTDAVNIEDVEKIIQHVFAYPDFKISKYSKGKMTNAEAVQMMSGAFNNYSDILKLYAVMGLPNETTTKKETTSTIDLDELFKKETAKENTTTKEIKDTVNYLDYFEETKSNTPNLLDNITLKKDFNKKGITENDVQKIIQNIIKLTGQCTEGFNNLKLNEQHKQEDKIFYYAKPSSTMFANSEYIFEKNSKTSYAAYYEEIENKRISWKAFLAVPKKIKNAVAYVKINDGLSNADYIRHDLIVSGKIVASYLEYKKDNYNSIQVYQDGY